MSKHGETMRSFEISYFRATHYKGIKVSENMDTKDKRAMEIFKTKPYACCYGGITMIKAGGID